MLDVMFPPLREPSRGVVEEASAASEALTKKSLGTAAAAVACKEEEEEGIAATRHSEDSPASQEERTAGAQKCGGTNTKEAQVFSGRGGGDCSGSQEAWSGPMDDHKE